MITLTDQQVAGLGSSRRSLQMFEVRSDSGPRQTWGVRSSVPGLAITKHTGLSPRLHTALAPTPLHDWTITHISTGHGLGVYFPSALAAGRFAQHLRAADWLTGPDALKKTALITAVKASTIPIRDRCGDPIDTEQWVYERTIGQREATP